jgi:phytoene dehydrogenase-like protein
MSKNSWEPDETAMTYDAIVVGASLGGCASAAILANKGFKVALLEHLDVVGGKHGASNHKDFWINWGHRDAVNGIGDQLTIPLKESYEAAGIDVKVIKGAYGNSVRIHLLPEEKMTEISFDEMMGSDVASLGYDKMEGYRRRARTYGCPEDQLEQTAIDLKAAMDKLSAMTEEECYANVYVTLGDWLRRHVHNPYVRNVLIANLESTQSSPGEDASVGRYAMFALKMAPRKLSDSGPVVDDNSPAAAEQAFVTVFHHRFLELGGDSFLGWKPIEIVVDNPHGGSTMRVSGVVAKDKSNFIKHLRAPLVITDYYGWDLGKLLDEELLPVYFRDRAAEVKRYATDVVAWWAGLKRLPRLRSTGKVENYPGWQRVQYGLGAVKEYHGGFHFMSLQDPKVAPPGKHLLSMSQGHQDRFQSWSQAKTDIDIAIQYLHNYYLDLDECIEWSHYQWVDPPQVQSWAYKPVIGHPVKVSTIEGLYMASASSEVASLRFPIGGMWSLCESAAAIEVTELIMQEYADVAGSAAKARAKK